MRRAMILVLLLSGCAGQPFVPDTARFPPNGFGGGTLDPDVQATNLAAWAFADPSRTRNDPVDAARATASMDYIAGELYTSPRWANISAVTKMQLLQGRTEMREAIGVAPNAPSQLVVNGLTGAGNALAAGNQGAALAALENPAFPNPQATLARLYALPYIHMANVSTMRAAGQLYDSNTRDWF